MVGNNQHFRAGALKVGNAADFGAKQKTEQALHQRAGQRIRQQRADIHGNRGTGQRRRQKKLRQGKAEGKKNDGKNRRQHHTQRIKNIVAGNDIHAAPESQREQVKAQTEGMRPRKKFGKGNFFRRGRITVGKPIQQKQADAHADGRKRHVSRMDEAFQKPVAAIGTGRHADRKQHQKKGDDAFPGIEYFAAQRIDLHRHQRTDGPKPGGAENAHENLPVFKQKAEIFQRGGKQVGGNLQFRPRRRRRRNLPGGQPAGGRQQNQQPDRYLNRQQGAENQPQQNRHIGGAFDIGVAGDQFFGFQVLRQKGVFDRPEKGRLCTHQSHNHDQKRQAVPVISQSHPEHQQQFGYFQHAGDFVARIFVRQLPGHGRKKEKRQNEKARDQVRKNVRLRRHLHGHQRQQGIFEQVVIQGTQKLGNHQGQETFGFQQHKFFLSQISKTKA